MNPIRTAIKCCGCILLSQLIGLLISVGMVVAFVLFFKFYLMPWGEDQIRDSLGLASDVDIGSLNASYIAANNCSGCVFGVNTDWPTNTTGMRHFLDTSAGTTASTVIATSLAGAAVIGTGSMLWASIVPSAASIMSFSSGFYEMTHILEQAQFIGMISQLQITGAPKFLDEFSKELAWTNFNFVKSSDDDDDDDNDDENTRRRLTSSLLASSGEAGPTKYASMIGVDPENLFFYTLLMFVIVIAAVHALYVVWVVVVSCFSKKESFSEVATKWYRKVIWVTVLALLLAQYIFAMAGSFFIYYRSENSETTGSTFILGIIGLIFMVGVTLLLGIVVVGSNTDELKDVGTVEHEKRPFSMKYSAYYDEYNFDNRFFFVPRILLAVLTGVIVGVVQDASIQLLCILGITLLYLGLLLIREPNLLRFLYYIGLASVFMKVVLVCMMLVLCQDDYFPQSMRDNVSYGIIGVNIFVFFLLFLRQAYVIIHKLVKVCKSKNADRSNDINLENGNDHDSRPYARIEPTPEASGHKSMQAMPSSANRNEPPSQPIIGAAVAHQRAQYGQSRPTSMENVGAAGGTYGVRNSVRFAPDSQSQEPQYSQNAAMASGAAAGAANTNKTPGANQPYRAARRNQGSKLPYQRSGASAMSGASIPGSNAPTSNDQALGAAAIAATAAYKASQMPRQDSGGAEARFYSTPQRRNSVDVDELDDDALMTNSSLAAAVVAANKAPQQQQPFQRQQPSQQSWAPASNSQSASIFDAAPRKRNSFIAIDDEAYDLETNRSGADLSGFGSSVVGSRGTQPISNFSTDTADDSAWMSRRGGGDLGDSLYVPRAGGQADSTHVSAFRDSDLDSYSSARVFNFNDTNRSAIPMDDLNSSRGDIVPSSAYNSHLTDSDADSYTSGQDMDSNRSFLDTNSHVSDTGSSSTAPSAKYDNLASAYLREVGENTTITESDLGVEDEGYGNYDESNGRGGSFMSAVSARSDDDVSYYINGDRTTVVPTNTQQDTQPKPVKL